MSEVADDVYPIEAEQPIINAVAERAGWVMVSGVAIASMALAALYEAGWRLVYPPDFPGLCGRCRQPIAAGTQHHPFNGNQMFACSVVNVEVLG